MTTRLARRLRVALVRRRCTERPPLLPRARRAALAAEREAPEETHARPAVRDLVSGLLVTGRTGPELRGLAARCGVT